ncbi:hypothetical protein ACJX0J_014031, partial [Zea mays]
RSRIPIGDRHQQLTVTFSNTLHLLEQSHLLQRPTRQRPDRPTLPPRDRNTKTLAQAHTTPPGPGRPAPPSHVPTGLRAQNPNLLAIKVGVQSVGCCYATESASPRRSRTGKAAMAAATAVGGHDRVEAAASSAGAVLAVAVASQRLIGLLALAVQTVNCVAEIYNEDQQEIY